MCEGASEGEVWGRGVSLRLIIIHILISILIHISIIISILIIILIHIYIIINILIYIISFFCFLKIPFAFLI